MELTALLLPAIEDGYMLKSCLEMMEMMYIVKGVLTRRRVISKEEGELAKEQGCNPGYSHPNPNAGISSTCSVQCFCSLMKNSEEPHTCFRWITMHAWFQGI